MLKACSIQVVTITHYFYEIAFTLHNQIDCDKNLSKRIQDVFWYPNKHKIKADCKLLQSQSDYVISLGRALSLPPLKSM